MPAPLPPPPLVIFDYSKFAAMYPELSGVGSQLAQEYFDLACTLCRNDWRNPAAPFGYLDKLLYMATAHVTWLYAPRGPDGQPAAAGAAASPLVGQVTSATEGSVSVQVAAAPMAGESAWWWNQTKYGAMFWAASTAFRRMQYFANPTMVAPAVYPYSPFYR